MNNKKESIVTEVNEPMEPKPSLSLNDKDLKNNVFVQWSILGNDMYYPCKKTMNVLKKGLYDIVYNDNLNKFVLHKQPINTDELYELPTCEIEEILTDIKSFWNKAEMFKKFNLVHKRGILLYGDPGCYKYNNYYSE